MKVVIQRVSSSSVRVDGSVVGSIAHGLLVLLGIRKEDTEADAHALAERCVALRVFSDQDGKMNHSVRDVGGSLLVVSQFTLYGDTRKGTRPSYSDAAEPVLAEKLYDVFCDRLAALAGPERVQRGVFGAMMEVELINNGPVTVIIESKPSAGSAS